MPKPEWPAAERALLLKLIQEGKTPFQCFEEFQAAGIPRTQKAITRQLDRRRKESPHIWHAMVRPASKAKLHVHPLMVSAARAMVMCDLHCPFHDSEWINSLVALAIQRRITDLILGGDIIDNQAFSKYEKDPDIPAEYEMGVTEETVTMLSRSFERVWCIIGSHDKRFARSMGWSLSVQKSLDSFIDVGVESVKKSDYCWMQLTSAGEQYRIVHPRNSSVNATYVPRVLAAKYQCHIIAGHGHLAGIARDISGKYWAVDTGICAHPAKLAYNEKEMNTRPAMLRGAVMVLDGVPWLVTPENIGAY